MMCPLLARLAAIEGHQFLMGCGQHFGLPFVGCRSDLPIGWGRCSAVGFNLILLVKVLLMGRMLPFSVGRVINDAGQGNNSGRDIKCCHHSLATAIRQLSGRNSV